MKQSNGDLRYIEQKLGLTDGYLSSKEGVSIIEIPKPSNIRISSGNERGANEFWIPGGITSGGVSEAVVDTPTSSSEFEALNLSDYRFE